MQTQGFRWVSAGFPFRRFNASRARPILPFSPIAPNRYLQRRHTPQGIAFDGANIGWRITVTTAFLNSSHRTFTIRLPTERLSHVMLCRDAIVMRGVMPF